MDRLSRYDAGEHAAVWAEIRALGPSPEADAIAARLMERVRANLIRLHDALLDDGYVFARPDALRPPSADAEEQLATIEHAIGPVPTAIKAWIRVVGSVDLIGRHPEWSTEDADPLVVEPLLPALVEQHEHWLELGWYERYGLKSIQLDLAPDRLHKADTSGGPPYGVALPDAAVDPRWLGDALHEGATFVEYLRSALLRGGGFPAWEGPSEVRARWVARMRSF